MEESTVSPSNKQNQSNSVTKTNIRISEDKKWIMIIKTETTFFRTNYISAILNSERKSNLEKDKSGDALEF
jgi:hypothetical protein